MQNDEDEQMVNKETTSPAETNGNETSKEFTSRLDRDALYRSAALAAAVKRAGQDGGIQDQKVDVLVLADVYYNWCKGSGQTESPVLEKMKEEETELELKKLREGNEELPDEDPG